MAFLQDPARQPLLRVPAATIGLLVALIAAHIARVMASETTSMAIIANYAFYPARYSHAFLVAHGNYSQTWSERAVPFVSYIFLHANFTHLAINCIWLLPFGAITARRFGALSFFAFFLLCGAAGAALYLAFHWGSTEPVVGASGAISGLMGAGFRMLPMPGDFVSESETSTDGNYPLRVRRKLAPIFSRRILEWSALWIAINVVAGVTGLGTGPGVQLVAWQAHIGGYLAGLVLAGPFDALGFRPNAASARA